MRRKDRLMPVGDAVKLLKEGTWGVLSTSYDNEPYGVPLNYVYSAEENALFFHCALEGRKLDNIRRNDKVSFTVVAKAEVVPDKFTTHYESVIVSGRAAIIDDEEEKVKRLRQLCEALAPAEESEIEKAIEESVSHTAIIRVDIEGLWGKRNL